MRKVFTKIICTVAAAVSALGIVTVAACSDVYKSKPLEGYTSTQDKAVSNGGFVVEKGDYVYFINGQESNTADNTYGKAVRGAIMRISKSDLSARNYSKVDTVVPQIAYSGNANGGIFIYGDYVYYSTPSTELNSDGEVQSSSLAFKRTRLDGTESMKEYFVQYDNNSIEYRYVEVGGVVYLLYVATGEDLYDTDASYTNLHSVNTQTGVDTLLAYNAGSVIFDSSDVTNPRVFYTMNVTDFELETTFSYNQVYTVTADETKATDYSEYFNKVYEDEEDGYDPEKDPKYVNCGTLVYDGIGKIEGMKDSVTVFNHPDAANVTNQAYSYSLSSYQNGNLFYTRKIANNSSSLSSLYMESVGSITASGWNPITANDSAKALIEDGSSASSYTYLFDGNGKISCILITTSNGLVKTTLSSEDKIPYTDDKSIDNVDTYYIMTDGQPTVLFTANHDGVNYVYYSLSGGNGYTVNRISYDGTSSADYHNPFGGEKNKFTPVKVLDIDATSGWYKPELIEGQLLFSSQTDKMTSYPYIMACDLRVGQKIMTNEQIDELNKKYEGVKEDIEAVDSSVYEHLQDALWYAHFTADDKYIGELIKAFQDVRGYDEEYYWSKESVEIYNNFLKAEKDWSSYAEDTVTVNGVKVAANMRDYYYSLLGKMSDDDAEKYSDSLKSAYMPDWPEPEEKEAWFDTLSSGAKAGFIIGVCAGGIIVILLAAFLIKKIIKKRKSKMPVFKKKRIKVDTTDDKDIDVYADEQNESSENTENKE